MTQKNFSGIIREAIKKSGLSLRAFAKKCSIDSSYLSKVLKGKRNPPAEEKAIAKIADFIGMSPERLMFVCGRIPSRLQKVFLREDIFEIIEDLPPEDTRRQTKSSPAFHSEPKPVFKRQEIPDELL
ncbi:MAG: helix-turn-helix transcriptional regulator [Elusimicrobiota bacterium]|nr:helix-turn-helix transcriptional regulator [Elusimicrobiota bacterium]